MAGSNLTLLSSYYTDHMASSNLTLHSNYYTNHSGPSSCLSLDEVNCFVFYAMRPFFSHLMYFVFPESSCILLKIKCQFFQAICGYFICLLFLLLLLLLKYHSPLWTLVSNTALFHSFQSLANILGNKQHFTF